MKVDEPVYWPFLREAESAARQAVSNICALYQALSAVGTQEDWKYPIGWTVCNAEARLEPDATENILFAERWKETKQ